MNKSQICKRIIRFTLKIGMILSLVGIAFWLFSYLSCEQNKTPLSLTQPQITLSAEYVAVTEAWLQVQTENISGKHQLKVWRDTTIVFNVEFAAADTTVYDSTLLPAHNYTYNAAVVKSGKNLVESQPLKITTMDTTSHDFQWEITTIESPYGSGVLRDVAIINENDIWAVGEVYADSAQPWLPYNAVHWDGQQWELKRIPYIYNGQPYYHPMNFAFSFENGEVWFGGNGIVKWNGNNFSNVEVDQSAWGSVAINKMWGSSPVNVLIVGNEGSIAHYDGSSWQKIESGTELPINDIWGSLNQGTGKWEILCIASNQFINQGKRLLRIESTGVTQLADSGLSWALNTVWHVSGRIYFVGGDGLYHSRTIGPIWYRDASFPPYYKTSVRGNHINDIVVVGAFGFLMHYNGASWRNYPDIPYMPSGAFGRVEVKGNIVVAVGGSDNKGLVLMGIR